MRVQTFSIVAGSEACNARCGFCVSKMTPPNGITLTAPIVRWDRFRKACQFARMMNVTTVMITGKGEPTLFPQGITDYLIAMADFDFPFIELQTNGLRIAEERLYEDARRGGGGLLASWRGYGLTTVAISIAHYLPERNREIYYPDRPNKAYPDLQKLIERIHDSRLSVRLSAVLIDGYIDSAAGVERLIDFARANGVEQLTLRPVSKPSVGGPLVDADQFDVYDWVVVHQLTPVQTDAITNHLREVGTEVLRLQHGAVVYDVKGQNVCLTECLTLPVGEDIRQVIFFPDGHLRYDWQLPGAILM